MKGRTYRYFTGEPLFPFGFGLSYTTFAYRNLTSDSVEVENTGRTAGEDVVQVYVNHSLESFQRVALRPKNARPSTSPKPR